MKKFKTLAAGALALAMVFSLAACGSTGSSSAAQSTPAGSTAASSTASQGEKKTYIIATDTTFAPFEFEDESGNKVGIDMDLIKAIAADQGFEVEIQALGFNAALQVKISDAFWRLLSGQDHALFQPR